MMIRPLVFLTTILAAGAMPVETAINPKSFQIIIETDMDSKFGNDPVDVFYPTLPGGMDTASKTKSLPVTYTAGDQLGVQLGRWYWAYDGGLAPKLAGICADKTNANKNPDNSGSEIFVNSDCTLSSATLPVYGIGFPSYIAADFKLEKKGGVCTLSISSVAGLTDELATKDACNYPCAGFGTACTPAQLHETVGCGKLVAGDYTADFGTLGRPITDFSQVKPIRAGLVKKCAATPPLDAEGDVTPTSSIEIDYVDLCIDKINPPVTTETIQKGATPHRKKYPPGNPTGTLVEFTYGADGDIDFDISTNSAVPGPTFFSVPTRILAVQTGAPECALSEWNGLHGPEDLRGVSTGWCGEADCPTAYRTPTSGPAFRVRDTAAKKFRVEWCAVQAEPHNLKFCNNPAFAAQNLKPWKVTDNCAYLCWADRVKSAKPCKSFCTVAPFTGTNPALEPPPGPIGERLGDYCEDGWQPDTCANSGGSKCMC